MLVIVVPVGVAESRLIRAAGLNVILPYLYGLNLAVFAVVRALWSLIGDRRAVGQTAPVADDGERR
jgi:hypothetical protein